MASTAAPLGGIRQRSKMGWSPRRLVGLEFKRGVATWLIPLALIPLWFIIRQDFTTPISLWVETGVSIRTALSYLGPVFGGAAAWVAAREHRRGAGELLETTPLPAPRRWVATWAGTALAALLTGLVVAVPLMTLTASRATWGGPEWWPIIVGLSAMVAHTAVGFAFGAWFPSRFTAPVMTVLLFLGEVYVGEFAGNGATILTLVSRLDNLIGEGRYLSPVAETSEDLAYGIWPAVGMWQTMWLLGGSVVMLALVALRTRRSAGAFLALIAGLTVSLGGATEIVQRTPGSLYFFTAFANHTRAATPATFVPTCQGDPVTVCLHPAYGAWMDEVVTRSDRVLAPIAGRPGAPVAITQLDPTPRYTPVDIVSPEGTVPFYLWSGNAGVDEAMRDIARCSIQSCYDERQFALPEEAQLAQEVVVTWLLIQAGEVDELTDDYGLYFQYSGEPLTPYLDRFAALSPAERGLWFDRYLTDLLAGRLTLADLP